MYVVFGTFLMGLYGGEKTHINKSLKIPGQSHRFGGSSRDWVGGKIYVCGFWDIPYGRFWRRENTFDQIPENPGTIPQNSCLPPFKNTCRHEQFIFESSSGLLPR